MEAINKEIATSKSLKAGHPEVEAEAVAEVISEAIEEEGEATEVADKTMTMEAHPGAEVPELATEVEAATAVKVEATKKVVVDSDQKLLAHQVAVLQWSRRAEALAPWCMFPTLDSK